MLNKCNALFFGTPRQRPRHSEDASVDSDDRVNDPATNHRSDQWESTLRARETGTIPKSNDIFAPVSFLVPETHCRLVGAGLGASFTDLIRVTRPAGVARGIAVAARVRHRRDQYTVPV
jgi:hypothetical protein